MYYLKLAIGISLLFGLSALGLAETPASQPTSRQAEWGKVKTGIQTHLSLAATAHVGGPLKLELRLRNAGTADVVLGPAKEVFGWLVIVQGKTGYYSERIFCAEGLPDWPEKLGAGQEIVLPTIDLSNAKAYAYADGKKLLLAYLGDGKDEMPAPAGELTKLLAVVDARAQWVLYLPGGGPSSPRLALTSNMAEFPILAAGAAPKAGQATTGLAKKFWKDAYSAKEAHEEAVKIGQPALPELIAIAKDPRAPDYTRMWAATALAGIPCEESASALTELAASEAPEVRHVVAYQGPKLHDAKLEAAILKRALGGDDVVAAWAVRGFATFGGRGVPEDLLTAALASRQPEARAAAAEALAGDTRAESLGKLLSLLKDSDERVRSAAAGAVGRRKLAASEKGRALASLIAALDTPGESARQQICATLSKLSGKDMPYDPKADEPKRREVLRSWHKWWDAQNAI